ncbi:Quinone oxidoreductase [Hondaea fermentalgiana]|uniref:Quinone oxidoreductase n=1 Tax=Hondaea fermentalgiana TaxID=2315210 RepID=A0A2R5GDH8_9STRA|nr:Quinone oxidoreductase [Hondaea fermentalgiana]|eukprot:GBG28997.1 Quinone oxidoreductase [Hondaea fermentalgiana]
MRAAVVQEHGAPDAVLRVVDDFPKPTLGRCSSMMVVRVLAVSLNAADDIILSGRARGLMNNVKFPYALGGDICGIVEETGGLCRHFNVGDRIMASVDFDDKHGMGEFALVSPKRAALAPQGLTALEAASLPTVGLTALQALAQSKVSPEERVLVLGGSTGVGLAVIQLLKDAGVGFVAATSQNSDLVMSVGADMVIDYTQVEWWTQVDSINVIIDAVGGASTMQHCMDVFTARSGRLVSLNPFGIDMEITTKWDAFRAVGGFIKTSCKQRWSRSFKMDVVHFKVTDQRMKEVQHAVEHGRLRPVLDERCPFAFDEASVIEAANILHAHASKGKLVIRVADEEGEAVDEDEDVENDAVHAKTGSSVAFPIAKLVDDGEPNE